jgi:hypothetical protein
MMILKRVRIINPIKRKKKPLGTGVWRMMSKFSSLLWHKVVRQNGLRWLQKCKVEQANSVGKDGITI